MSSGTPYIEPYQYHAPADDDSYTVDELSGDPEFVINDLSEDNNG